MSVHCHQGRLGDCSSSGTTSGKRRGVQLSTEFRHSELSIAAAGTELAGIWWTNGWVWTELMPIHAYTLRFMSIFKLENDDETVDGMLLDNPLWTGPNIMWPHVLVQLDWSLGLALNDAELDPQMSELVLQHPKREGCFHCLMLCHRMPQAKKCRWVRVRLLETRRNNGPC